MKQRTICVVNGKRGGFNALLPTMKSIAQDPKLKLQVVLTDMHLSRMFGRTLDYAKKWIKINATVDMAQIGATPKERTEALGRGLTGFAQTFSKLKPDIVLLLGDRSETLTAAFAALQLRIPVAHIQGGEISGNIDGIQRHAITKLSHIHFTETKKAKEVVEKLGEENSRVHFVGAPYIDFIAKKLYTPEREVRKKFGLGAREPFLLVLQHPVTTEPEESYNQMKKTLRAVKNTGLRAIVAYPCSDQGYQGVIDAIKEWGGGFKNIPAEDFIGLEACASALVGNSSAGIYEAPYVFCPAVNIGRRQEGRERENNIIDVPHNVLAIEKAIKKASNADFKKCIQPRGIYGDGKAHERIVKALKTFPLRDELFNKKLIWGH
ncbi:MAG: UDP-N-acetylglucosamine 2-epimerase [Patescibacteria group bacterium]